MIGYLQTFLTKETIGQFIKTALVGTVNFAATAAIFNGMRVVGLSVFWAITVAFGLTTVTAYVINRRWSFKLNDGRENVGETTRFVVINILGWGGTILLMSLAESWFGPLSRIGENVALFVVAGIIFIPKFATYRDVVFKSALNERDPSGEPVSADR